MLCIVLFGLFNFRTEGSNQVKLDENTEITEEK